MQSISNLYVIMFQKKTEGCFLKKKLDINLLKNNNLTYTKKDVSYDTYNNIIKYNLDDVVNTLELLEDGVIFTR